MPNAGSLGLHRITVSTTGSATSTDVPLDTSIAIDQLEQQGTFRPFGRSIPVTVRGDLYEEEFDIAMLFLGETEYQTFVQLRNRRVTLCLRSDQGPVYYGTLGAARVVGLLRAADRLTNPYRVLEMHVTPAAIPAAPGS